MERKPFYIIDRANTVFFAEWLVNNAIEQDVKKAYKRIVYAADNPQEWLELKVDIANTIQKQNSELSQVEIIRNISDDEYLKRLVIPQDQDEESSYNKAIKNYCTRTRADSVSA